MPRKRQNADQLKFLAFEKEILRLQRIIAKLEVKVISLESGIIAVDEISPFSPNNMDKYEKVCEQIDKLKPPVA